MSVYLTWYGHGTWAIKTEEHTVILDPFFTDSPTSPVAVKDVDADFILVSHGHFDHIADCAELANRTGAMVIAIFEIAQWLTGKQAVVNTTGMNIGGKIELAFGTVKMTPAFHSSQLPDGSYGGEPAGFLLTINGKKVYFACDTALFSDMQLIGDEDIDLAILPIGDLFTMGPEDSIKATQLIRPRAVLPAHYDTWPPIEQDGEAWAQQIREQTQAHPIVLQPGATHQV